MRTFVTCTVRWSVGLFRHGREGCKVAVDQSTLPDPLLYHRGLYFPLSSAAYPSSSSSSSHNCPGGGHGDGSSNWRPCCPLPTDWLSALWRSDDAPLRSAARLRIEASKAAAAANAAAAAYEERGGAAREVAAAARRATRRAAAA